MVGSGPPRSSRSIVFVGHQEFTERSPSRRPIAPCRSLGAVTMLVMSACSLSCVEEVLSVLATGYGVPARPDHPDMDLLTHSLISASQARTIRPADAEFQVAALLLDIGRLLPQPARTRRSRDATAEEIRELLGRRVADLVALRADTVAYRALLDSTSFDDRTDATNGFELISPARLRRLRRHRSFADSMALAALVDDADRSAPVPPLLSFRPILDAVAAATAGERELALYSLHLIAIPR